MRAARYIPVSPGVPEASRSGRGFNPYDVAETVVWFSPRAGVTNASGAASAWSSQYPAGTYTAAQATAGRRPTIGTGINGRPSLDFASVNNQELTNTTQLLVADGAPRYLAVVAKGVAGSTGTGGALFMFHGNIVSGTAWLLYCWDNAGTRQYMFDGAGGFTEPTAGAPAITSPFLIEFELTFGQTPVVRINGVERSLSGTISNQGGGQAGFVIASGTLAGQEFNGSIADVYVAAGIPSAADRTKLRAYLAGVNGITL